MIKEILPARSKKMLAPSSHHFLVSVSFVWKQLTKQQNKSVQEQHPLRKLK